ncbi:hypothetical protein KJ925_04580 [Patescibacteria group bacterium]|nr:hypothetical protein [Patescibacteria group bacterium]
MSNVGLGEGIAGHATILRILGMWLDHPRHGYVFYGMPHLGKRTVAERFVGALLGVGYPLPDVHADLLMLVPEEGKVQVSVERVRKVRGRLAEHPMVAPRVVTFVPEAERLNEEGWNALLKVMEEPPAGAVFVFVANDISRLPATVMSRLTPIPFGTVPAADIVAELVRRGVPEAEARRRATECRGRPGLAFEPEERDESDVKRYLSATKLGERLAVVDRLSVACESSEEPRTAWIAALETWGEACRRALPDLGPTAIVAAEGVITARRFVGGPISPRVPLEAAALRLAAARPLAGLFPSHVPRALPAVFPSRS